MKIYHGLGELLEQGFKVVDSLQSNIIKVSALDSTREVYLINHKYNSYGVLLLSLYTGDLIALSTTAVSLYRRKDLEHLLTCPYSQYLEYISKVYNRYRKV